MDSYIILVLRKLGLYGTSASPLPDQEVISQVSRPHGQSFPKFCYCPGRLHPPHREYVSDTAARAKEAEVMPVIGPLRIVFSELVSYSIDLTSLSYWKPCPPLGSVLSATPKKYLL